MELERFETAPWISYVGDCKALNSYLETKSGYSWLVPKFVNAILRGFSQVLFANNPFTGLLLVLSLFWVDVTVGILAVLAASISILTALLMKQNVGSIQAGLTTYNGLLVGCVTASLWTPIYNEPLSTKLILFIIIGAILSVFLTSATANILSSFKLSLPCLTLPFNIINIILFLILMPPATMVSTPTTTTPRTEMSQITSGIFASTESTNYSYVDPFGNNSDFKQSINGSHIPNNSDGGPDPKIISDFGEENSIQWGKVFIGVILSMGQVFAVESVFGSILMYVAIIIYSPILFLMSLIGAAIGTFSGLLFTSGSTYAAVYAGIYGYNTLLSASSVGGFFIVLTCHSFWTSIANVIFTAIFQQAFVLAFHSLRLPMFTLPFVLSTFLFLSVTSSGNQLPRVANISFPELHRFEFMEKIRKKRNNTNGTSSTENKEPVFNDGKRDEDQLNV